MDISPYASTVEAIAEAVITACIPVAISYLLRKLGQDKNEALRASLNNMAKMAAGVAYQKVVTTSSSFNNVSTHSVACDEAAQMFLLMAKPALDQLSRSKDDFASMVAGEFGNLLHTDSSVQIPASTLAVGASVAVTKIPVAVIGDTIKA